MSSKSPDALLQLGEVTVLLRQITDGRTEARGELFSRLYPDLKRLARLRMNRERPDHTLQPTALVSELFLTLYSAKGINWRDRAHFFALASQMMKRYLTDYARARKAERRGGGRSGVSIECAELSVEPMDALEFTELVDKLMIEEPRMARVVEMRCFAGLTHAEIAEALGMDERTSKRDWQVARAWLRAQLTKRSSPHAE
jgi:RNA polymerase sigma factor (TIGR02999 family)